MHPALAASILAAAMLLRVLVPVGFMPVVEHGRIALVVCPGVTRAAPAMAGMAHHGDDAATAADGCAFADLSLPVLPGADPALLAAAILFLIVTARLLAHAPPPHAAPRLRPPLRGPPILLR